jgi:hypothetical protein
MLGDQEGDDGPVASTRNTARFETRQAFRDRTLRLGQLLAAYHCAVDIETKAMAQIAEQEEAGQPIEIWFQML